MEARLALFTKYESGVFSVDADQNEVVQELAEDALTWDALIHTTYFDHREIAAAIAAYAAEQIEMANEPAGELMPPAKKYVRRNLDRAPCQNLPRLGAGASPVLLSVWPRYWALLPSWRCKAVPMVNNDHLADERSFIPPPVPYVIGQTFNDCDVCPELVVLPGGTFSMGSPSHELERTPNEGPMQRVTVQPFAVGKFEVTFAEWDACVADGGCDGYSPNDRGWGRGDQPVINVSWNNAQRYVAWLNGKVEGSPYRLLSEAEWEYAARAGTTTPYWWGEEASHEYANYGFEIGQTTPVGSYPANPFGLHDMHGNLFEWVGDCYRSNPGPSSDVSKGMGNTECLRVLRGGDWYFNSRELHSASRDRDKPTTQSRIYGFRIARTLE